MKIIMLRLLLILLRSDIHLLNSGSYSKIWKYLKPKTKKRIILRLDGIGIDINNQTNHNIVKQKYFYD